MTNLIVRSPADKGHTCERSRNPDGSLSGADRSTAADADLWDADDVFRYPSPAVSRHPLLDLAHAAKAASLSRRWRRAGRCRTAE